MITAIQDILASKPHWFIRQGTLLVILLILLLAGSMCFVPFRVLHEARVVIIKVTPLAEGDGWMAVMKVMQQEGANIKSGQIIWFIPDSMTARQSGKLRGEMEEVVAPAGHAGPNEIWRVRLQQDSKGTFYRPMLLKPGTAGRGTFIKNERLIQLMLQ